MKRVERDSRIITRMLEDIETLQERVVHFNLTAQSFADDRSFEGEIAFDATMNPLYRIVEDAVHLSDEVTESMPEIPCITYGDSGTSWPMVIGRSTVMLLG